MNFWLTRAVLFAVALWLMVSCSLANTDQTIAFAALPEPAQLTIMRIEQGEPLPYPKDGSVFGNYEKLLPMQPKGYYREYTVPTPSSQTRGKRRIVAGKAKEYYYTADHYQSFRKVLR